MLTLNCCNRRAASTRRHMALRLRRQNKSKLSSGCGTTRGSRIAAPEQTESSPAEYLDITCRRLSHPRWRFRLLQNVGRVACKLGLKLTDLIYPSASYHRIAALILAIYRIVVDPHEYWVLEQYPVIDAVGEMENIGIQCDASRAVNESRQFGCRPRLPSN